jgi:hypothetical protein
LLSQYLVAGAYFQSAACPDAADEPHHQLLYQNESTRVFLLDLPRLASTASHCHPHPYLYVVAGAGRSLNTLQGQGSMSHDWYGGEARFVYEHKQHVVRNEAGSPHRELIVETLHPTTYDSMGGNLDIDLFPGGLGSVKPSWTVSFTRGALTASKTQLAPDDEIPVSSPYHVILALSDLDLSKQVSGKRAEALEMSAEDARILPGGSDFKLVNTGQRPAMFVLVEF